MFFTSITKTHSVDMNCEGTVQVFKERVRQRVFMTSASNTKPAIIAACLHERQKALTLHSTSITNKLINQAPLMQILVTKLLIETHFKTKNYFTYLFFGIAVTGGGSGWVTTDYLTYRYHKEFKDRNSRSMAKAVFVRKVSSFKYSPFDYLEVPS